MSLELKKLELRVGKLEKLLGKLANWTNFSLVEDEEKGKAAAEVDHGNRAPSTSTSTGTERPSRTRKSPARAAAMRSSGRDEPSVERKDESGLKMERPENDDDEDSSYGDNGGNVDNDAEMDMEDEDERIDPAYRPSGLQFEDDLSTDSNDSVSSEERELMNKIKREKIKTAGGDKTKARKTRSGRVSSVYGGPGKPRTGTTQRDKRKSRPKMPTAIIEGHPKGKDFQCPHCPRVIPHSRPSWYLEHLRIHTKERPLLCPHCGFTSARASGLRSHIQNKHEGDTAKRFMCEDCGRQYTQQKALKAHRDQYHREEAPEGLKQRKLCPHCQYFFDDDHKLADHIARVHENEEALKPVQCHHCPKRFRSEYWLDKHLQRVNTPFWERKGKPQTQTSTSRNSNSNTKTNPGSFSSGANEGEEELEEEGVIAERISPASSAITTINRNTLSQNQYQRQEARNAPSLLTPVALQYQNQQIQPQLPHLPQLSHLHQNQHQHLNYNMPWN